LSTSSFSQNSKTALIGFDGFIDKIFRIKRNNDVFFEKSNQFGEYILDKKGNSFSLEIEGVLTKIGGNAVILANALANLGIKNNLIASLGFPHKNPLFEKIHSNCTLHSYAEPGITYAYEFADSKIMLAQNGPLNTINWENLKELIGLEKLINLFEINYLYCLLNWSEIKGMTSIWQGILQEILPKLSENKKRTTFFDLADCSNRDSNDLKNILSVISAYTKYSKVILSLNKNETEVIFHSLFSEKNESFREMGEIIFSELNIDKLILHHSKESFCISQNEIPLKGAYTNRTMNIRGFHETIRKQLYTHETICSKTYFQENPFISTGAGDHFNAGFCTAILNEFSIESSLQFANATAHLYISSGQSPNFNQVSYFIDNQVDANNNL
jgi:hypothetical protein